MKDIIDVSIEDDAYKKYEEVWKFALEMTKKECAQAAEGCLHNLNSLMSRSGKKFIPMIA